MTQVSQAAKLSVRISIPMYHLRHKMCSFSAPNTLCPSGNYLNPHHSKEHLCVLLQLSNSVLLSVLLTFIMWQPSIRWSREGKQMKVYINFFVGKTYYTALGTLLNVMWQPGWEGSLGGEWRHVVYGWLNPFALHLKLSQHC